MAGTLGLAVAEAAGLAAGVLDAAVVAVGEAVRGSLGSLVGICVGEGIALHAPCGRGVLVKSKKPLSGSATASRVANGASFQLRSMKALIDGVS